MYAAAQNRPSLLVETHSLKAARTRAWANYDIMRHSIDIITADPQALRRAVREADREMASRAGVRTAPPVYLAGKVSDKSRPLVYHALKTGQFQSEPDDLDTRIHDQIDTTVEARMPLGYLLPAAWKELAELLALHGIEMERTTKPIEQEFETYRFTGTKFAGASFEGRVMVDFEVKPVREKVALPAGSYWIPMKQRRARLILSMLEPQAPDSLARWGFMNQVFERGGRGDAGDAGRYPMVRVWEKTW